MSVQGPAAVRRAMLRMLAGSSLKYENQVSTATQPPIAPVATSSRTATHDGWRRYMNASIRTHAGGVAGRRPSRSASAAVIASGFSHRTCLPARLPAASTRRGGGWAAGCRPRRPRGRRAAPRTSRGARGCRAARRGAARAPASRDAIATTSQRAERCIAGITFSARDPGGRQDPPAQALAASTRVPSMPGNSTRPEPGVPRRGVLTPPQSCQAWHSFGEKEHKPWAPIACSRAPGQRSETVRRANLSAIVRAAARATGRSPGRTSWRAPA